MYLLPSLFFSVPIACSILILGFSALLKSPEVSVNGVSPSSITLSLLSLNVTVLVKNHNAFKINIKSLSFDVYYQNGDDWVYLSHGEKTNILINPGENEATIPVTIRNAELISSLAGFIYSRKITLQIRGIASPEILLLAPKVPFTYTTTISF
jgi:LEA14-like dessication related protein